MPDADITFKWGRIDCDMSPSTDDVYEFPEPTMNRTEMMDYFSENFAMNETEVMYDHTCYDALHSVSIIKMFVQSSIRY